MTSVILNIECVAEFTGTTSDKSGAEDGAGEFRRAGVRGIYFSFLLRSGRRKITFMLIYVVTTLAYEFTKATRFGHEIPTGWIFPDI